MQLVCASTITRKKGMSASDIDVLREWNMHKVVVHLHDGRRGYGEGNRDRSEETGGREHRRLVACCEGDRNMAKDEVPIKQSSIAIDGEN